MTLMRHRYGYEADEPSDWTGLDDTNPLDEPVIDYSIWPPEPPDPEEARDENLRRLGKLTWRAIQLSAVAAAGFAILFVRTAHTPVATTQDVARPAGTVAPPPSATPTPSPRHPRHKGRGRDDNPAPSPAPDVAAAPGTTAPGTTAPASPTLAPPTTPPAPSPSPSPAQSTSSGSHSGG